MTSKNAFLNFKDRYAGKPTEQDIKNTATESKMYDQYKAAYNSIINIMNSAKKTETYGTYAKQTEVLKGVAAVMEKMTSGSGSILSYAMKESAAYYAKLGLDDLAIIGKEPAKPETWHGDYNEEYVNQMFKDNFTHIAAQASSMTEAVKNELRQDSAKIFRMAAIKGISRKNAYKELKAEILGKDPTFKFTDKKGRQWSAENYLDMMTKTVMMNAGRESYINTLINEGQDLVIVSMHGAKDACKNWEKRVLSLTGATKGYPTIEEARASGEIFHPRCNHSVVAYHQDIEDVFNKVNAGASYKTITGSTKADLMALAKTKIAGKLNINNQHVVDHLKKATDEVIAGKLPMSALTNMAEAIADAEKNNGKPLNEEQISKMWEQRFSYAPTEDVHNAMWTENDFEKVGAQAGSNEGGVYKHKITGEKFYIKIPKTDNHVYNEIAASGLYELSGLKVPKLKSLRMNDGRLAVVSEWNTVKPLNELSESSFTHTQKEIQKGFAVDAWLGNWDVIGLTNDNIGVKDGNPFRIDVGGSMLFRAQGGEKGSSFGDVVEEFKNMTSQNMSPNASKIFGNMTKTKLMASMKTVIDLKESDITDIVSKSGFSGNIKNSLIKTLINRQNDIKKKYDELKTPKKSVKKLEPYIKHESTDWSFVEPTAEDITIFKKWETFKKYKNHLRQSHVVEKYGKILNEPEIVAIFSYTNSGYQILNSGLRRGKKSDNDPLVRSYQRILNQALRKIAAVCPTEKLEIHRGIDLYNDQSIKAFKEQWKVGAKRRILSNWSTSTDGRFGEDKNIQLKIKLKNKHPYVDDFSVCSGESEVILVSGSNFKCNKTWEEYNKDLEKTITWFELEEID